jgi:hypothetical protein
VAAGVPPDRGVVRTTGLRRLYIALIALRRGLGRFADALYGCAHRRTGFPITVGQQDAQSETYVVCLECGRHLTYDWTKMQVTGRAAARKSTPARFQ